MPETVTAVEAAKRIGISKSQFHRAVDRGELPGPCLKSRPWRWSWGAIEKALETPGEPASTLSDKNDPIMERIAQCGSG